MTKTTLIAGFLMAIIFSANAFGQKQDTESLVEAFYKFHGSRNGVLSLHELRLHKRFFSQDLYGLLLKELKREEEFTKKHPDEKPHFGDGLPFKPFEECIFNGKFVPNQHKVKEFSREDGKAVVKVSFFMPAECKSALVDVYQIELLKTGNRWLINDWIFPDKTKLSDDLKREKY